MTTEYPKPGDPLEPEFMEDGLTALAEGFRRAVRRGVAAELERWADALFAEADEVHGPQAEPDDQLGHLVGERERALREVADRVAARWSALQDPEPLRPVAPVDDEDVTAFISKWTEAADASDFLRKLTEQGSSPTGRILHNLIPPWQPVSGRRLPPLFIAANSVTQATEYATRERIAPRSWQILRSADQLRGYSEPTVWYLTSWWESWGTDHMTELEHLEDLPAGVPGRVVRVTDLAQLDPWRVP